MNKFESFLIQFHVALALMGYPLIQAFVTLAMGESTRMVSIGYDVFQLVISTLVVFMCSKDLLFEKGRSFFLLYSVFLALYAFRMLFDAAWGPFVNSLPQKVFWNDILLVVGHGFTAIYAVILSRKHLNIDIIVRLVFYFGFITLLLVMITIRLRGIGDMYLEERLQTGRGLHSLSLVRVGAIVVLAAFHLLFNSNRYKFLYSLGLLLGLWMTFASGSRGGVAGLTIALGIYWVASARKKWYLVLLAIIGVVLFLAYLVPILSWLSGFFPVVGNRMLLTILEGDQSGREILRAQAIDLILEHPFLGYGYRLNNDLTGYGPHNGVLEQFLCLGIPLGLLFLYSVYIKGIVYAIKLMVNRCFIFPATLTVFVIVSSMSGSSTDIMFGIAIALVGVAYYYGDKTPILLNSK